jgi:uncharacterized protein
VLGALLADDVVWTIPGSGSVAGTYRGKQSFMEAAAAPLIIRLATPLVPGVHAIWVEGGTVIVRFDAEAATTSGASYRNLGPALITADDSLDSFAEGVAFDFPMHQRGYRETSPRRTS